MVNVRVKDQGESKLTKGNSAQWLAHRTPPPFLLFTFVLFYWFKQLKVTTPLRCIHC